MTTLSIDHRHPHVTRAIDAMRSGDLERTGIFATHPELAVRVVRRVSMDMGNRIAARALGLEARA
ncbi:hypothetical protein [Solidesulfovibrio sp.]|uniref:hypothetical protein n=1 Tax=Solidesulfovibrio sp. TaxID=2910990 RepID=UPI0026239832|nr:hypothetical protein [Solidesulfovibrio sp.]